MGNTQSLPAEGQAIGNSLQLETSIQSSTKSWATMVRILCTCARPHASGTASQQVKAAAVVDCPRSWVAWMEPAALPL